MHARKSKMHGHGDLLEKLSVLCEVIYKNNREYYWQGVREPNNDEENAVAWGEALQFLLTYKVDTDGLEENEHFINTSVCKGRAQKLKHLDEENYFFK